MYLLTEECGTRKRLAKQTKPPILKQQSHAQEEQENINPIKDSAD